MKYLIIPLIPFIASCGNWLGVPENIDVSGEVEIVETRIKQVGSQVYIGLFAGDLIIVCLPVDPGTIYPDKWVTLDEAAEDRVSPVSSFELFNCL